jgi:hypothetical protein
MLLFRMKLLVFFVVLLGLKTISANHPTSDYPDDEFSGDENAQKSSSVSPVSSLANETPENIVTQKRGIFGRFRKSQVNPDSLAKDESSAPGTETKRKGFFSRSKKPSDDSTATATQDDSAAQKRGFIDRFRKSQTKSDSLPEGESASPETETKRQGFFSLFKKPADVTTAAANQDNAAPQKKGFLHRFRKSQTKSDSPSEDESSAPETTSKTPISQKLKNMAKGTGKVIVGTADRVVGIPAGAIVGAVTDPPRTFTNVRHVAENGGYHVDENGNKPFFRPSHIPGYVAAAAGGVVGGTGGALYGAAKASATGKILEIPKTSAEYMKKGAKGGAQAGFVGVAGPLSFVASAPAGAFRGAYLGGRHGASKINQRLIAPVGENRANLKLLKEKKRNNGNDYQAAKQNNQDESHETDREVSSHDENHTRDIGETDQGGDSHSKDDSHHEDITRQDDDADQEEKPRIKPKP